MLRGLFLVTLLSVLFQQGANFALEYGLEQLFSQQTGCDVTLDNTSINFFIARGTAKNVRFVCSDEKPGEELNVSQISVFISPLQLLRKRVVLSDLRLVGAKISSLQENSGFNRLMSFLFTPPKPDTGEDWHSFISEGWDVSVGDVDIASKTDEGVSLTVTYPGLRVSAKSVSFSVKGTPKGAASPIFVDGNDIELSIDQGDGWKYFLQDASVAGELSKGKVRILKSKLVLPSSENDEAAVVSPVFDLDYTKGLRVEGSIAANGSPEDLLPPSFDKLSLSKLKKVDLAVDGSFSVLNGESQGRFNFDFQFPELFPLSDLVKCKIPRLNGTAEISNSGIVVNQAKSDSILRKTKVAVDDGKIKSTLELRIPTRSEIASTCEMSIDDSGTRDAVTTFIEKNLNGSIIKVDLEGELEPLNLKIETDADLSPEILSEASKLKSIFTISNDLITIDFREDAKTVKLDEAIIPASQAATLFKLQQQTSLSGRIKYAFGADELSIRKIKATNYPVAMLWFRAKPFLPAEFEVDGIDDLIADATASFSGSLVVKDGQVRDGLFRAEICSLKIDGNEVPKAVLKAKFDAGGVQLERASVDVVDGNIAASGNFDWAGNGEIVGTANSLTLSKIEAVSSTIPGISANSNSSFSVKLAGDKLDWKVNGQVELVDLWKNSQLEDSIFEFVGDGNSFEGHGNFAGDKLVFLVKKKDGNTIEIDAKASEFPVRYFLEVDEDAAPFVDNLLSANLEYQFDPVEVLEGEGHLRVTQITRSRGEKTIDESLGEQEQPYLEFSNGRAILRNAKFRSNGKQFEIKGGISLIDGWELDLVGQWDLAKVVPLRHLEQLSGELSFDARVRGEISKPDIFGKVSLDEGRVSVLLNEQFVGAEDVSIEAIFDRDSVTVDSIKANIGAGSVVGKAKFQSIFSRLERKSILELEFRDVFLEPVDDFTALINGNLSFKEEALGGCFVRGELQLEQGLYQSTLDLRALIQNTSKALIGSRGTAVSRSSSSEDSQVPCGVDVSLLTKNAILIETPLLNAELKGNIELLAAPNESLKVAGAIEAISGTLGMKSNQFEILHGSLVFRPEHTEVDPLLDVLAETNVRTVEGEDALVQMVVRGRASDPLISFTSDYGLSETEIVSLLGFGASISNVSIFGNKSATDRSVGSLLNPISDVSFTDRLAGLSGFSEVQIDSVVSPRTGDTVPRFSVRRRLVDKLTAELSTEIGIIQESFADLEFPLTPYLNLIGGWKSNPITRNVESSSGSLNAGFEYRTTFPGTSLIPESLQW